MGMFIFSSKGYDIPFKKIDEKEAKKLFELIKKSSGYELTEQVGTGSLRAANKAKAEKPVNKQVGFGGGSFSNTHLVRQHRLAIKFTDQGVVFTLKWAVHTSTTAGMAKGYTNEIYSIYEASGTIAKF